MALSNACSNEYVLDDVRYNYVSMALIISSFGKMLLILMVIWDYKQLEYSWLVSLIVLASNAEALSGMSTNFHTILDI